MSPELLSGNRYKIFVGDTFKVVTANDGIYYIEAGQGMNGRINSTIRYQRGGSDPEAAHQTLTSATVDGNDPDVIGPGEFLNFRGLNEQEQPIEFTTASVVVNVELLDASMVIPDTLPEMPDRI